jgi:uncharacterized membrane protein
MVFRIGVPTSPRNVGTILNKEAPTFRPESLHCLPLNSSRSFVRLSIVKDLPKVETVEHLREQFGPPENVNAIHRSRLSTLDKLAIFVTEKIGTMGFFFIIITWTILWLSWNIFAPINLRFDPFPAFVLWLFISNLIQIQLMPLIMVGQNIQGKHAELRAELDFETNKKAEKEIEAILLHLENQQQLMLEILDRIEKLEKKK